MNKERDEEIRHLWDEWGLKQTIIGEMYGLTQTRVNSIIHRRKTVWRNCWGCKRRLEKERQGARKLCLECKNQRSENRKHLSKENDIARYKRRSEKRRLEAEARIRTCPNCKSSFTGFRKKVCDACRRKNEARICVFCQKLTGSVWRVCLTCAPYRGLCEGKNIQGRDMVRSLARARDRFICQECGFKRTPEDVAKMNKNLKKGEGKKKSLDVHHLYGMCGKNSRGYDKMEELPNLITLCHKFHYNRHDHSSRSVQKGSKGNVPSHQIQ